MRPIVFGFFGPREGSDLDAFWPPFSPPPYSSLDTFSQAKVLSVPGKRELTVPAREAPPTVETCFMELSMYFVGCFATLKQIKKYQVDNFETIVTSVCNRTSKENSLLGGSEDENGLIESGSKSRLSGIW